MSTSSCLLQPPLPGAVETGRANSSPSKALLVPHPGVVIAPSVLCWDLLEYQVLPPQITSCSPFLVHTMAWWCWDAAALGCAVPQGYLSNLSLRVAWGGELRVRNLPSNIIPLFLTSYFGCKSHIPLCYLLAAAAWRRNRVGTSTHFTAGSG